MRPAILIRQDDEGREGRRGGGIEGWMMQRATDNTVTQGRIGSPQAGGVVGETLRFRSPSSSDLFVPWGAGKPRHSSMAWIASGV